MKKIIIIIFGLIILTDVFGQKESKYLYDYLNRLSQVTYANGTVVNYTFDELGNRTTKTVKTATVTVAATASPVAGGAVTGAGSFTVGQSCMLAATATTGYSFVNWTENGVAVSTSASYVFTVSTARILIANFTANSYAVSASANPTAGGTITGTGNYSFGTSCTITAISNTGYTFTNWTENGTVVSTSASYIFTVSSARTLVANFTANSYAVSASANPTAGGTITGAGNYSYGTSCTLKATANTGYVFTNWTENGTVVSNVASYVFAVSKARTLVANFTANSYAIAATANPIVGGTITGAGNYSFGTSCTLTATTNTGYTFTNWTENGMVVYTSASYVFNVSTARTLVANFTANSYAVSSTANPTAGGTITGAGNYSFGTSCTLKATTNTGYVFTNWTENGTVVSTSASYVFNVSTSRTLVANFIANSYAVSASANPTAGGTITGAGNYTYGTSCTLKATANTGYVFTNWTENGTIVSTSASYVFAVSTIRTLVANFTANSYAIAANANPIVGGTITGAGNYTYGTSCTLKATANTGYVFTNWTENGTIVSTSASYVFMIAVARTMVANFVQNTVNYTVSSSASPTDGGTISGNGEYKGGTSCTLVATANTGYTFVNWTESGAQVSTSASYNFVIGGNRILVANFTPNQINYTVSASSSPTVGGTIVGSGSYQSGVACNLIASANSGYVFINWTENGIEVSTNSSYNFTVSANRTLVANFTQNSTITVSFKRPVNWGTADIYLWAWTPAGVNLFNTWPGIAMTNIGNGWYSYTFDQKITSINLIFSKSGTPQTVDITEVTQSTCYQSTGLSGVKLTVSTVSCPPTGLENNISKECILHLYPNPANTHLRISTKEVLHRLAVCDISGRVIQYETVNSDTYSLNVSHLAKGVYLIKGFTENGVVTSRFIKE